MACRACVIRSNGAEGATLHACCRASIICDQKSGDLNNCHLMTNESSRTMTLDTKHQAEKQECAGLVLFAAIVLINVTLYANKCCAATTQGRALYVPEASSRRIKQWCAVPTSLQYQSYRMCCLFLLQKSSMIAHQQKQWANQTMCDRCV